MSSSPTFNFRSPREITLGRLSFLIDGADVRYVRWNGIEIVRRIYVTIRDEDWDTPPDELHTQRVDADGQRASLNVEAISKSSAVDVDWHVNAEADLQGHLGYQAALNPRRPFPYSRMGLCVLFPPSALVDRPYVAWNGGHRVEGVFERLIAPQIVRGSEILPLFPAFDRLGVEMAGVGPVELTFSGDLLEMEDQRNWSDGSFKAYCTPLSVPRPHLADPSHPVKQNLNITVTPHRAADHRKRGRDEAIEITVGKPTGTLVPALGTLVRSLHVEDRAVESLRSIGFEHFRVEFRQPGDLAMHLESAAALAKRVGSLLVPALFLTGTEAEVGDAADRLAALDEAPARILVFPSHEHSETGTRTELVRRAMSGKLSEVPTIGGTDVWFVDLNRARPNQTLMDGVAWSVTPQVHMEDSLTIIEGLESHADQVNTARSFAPLLQLVIGPVTLRPRFNPNARDSRDQAINPPQSSIDPRQTELLPAAWTVGSLAALAQAGVTAVTYFEAVGPRGIMSDFGAVYPVGHVLAAAAGWIGKPVLAVASEQPMHATAFAVASEEKDDVSALLVANLTDSPKRIRVKAAQSMRPAARVLDRTGDGVSVWRPTQIDKPADLNGTVAAFELTLRAYQVARVDCLA